MTMDNDDDDDDWIDPFGHQLIAPSVRSNAEVHNLGASNMKDDDINK